MLASRRFPLLQPRDGHHYWHHCWLLSPLLMVTGQIDLPHLVPRTEKNKTWTPTMNRALYDIARPPARPPALLCFLFFTLTLRRVRIADLGWLPRSYGAISAAVSPEQERRSPS